MYEEMLPSALPFGIFAYRFVAKLPQLGESCVHLRFIHVAKDDKRAVPVAILTVAIESNWLLVSLRE